MKLKLLHGNRDLSFVARKGIESGDRMEICFDLGYLVVLKSYVWIQMNFYPNPDGLIDDNSRHHTLGGTQESKWTLFSFISGSSLHYKTTFSD